MRKDLEDKIRLLPKNPGVYVMLDADGIIIYVGKAKNLKNRVTQYFYDNVKTDKVMAMVSNIADFYYIITNSEADALSLENNLIKKNKPKYNILLKDDKTYPSIRIDLKKRFPYFEVVRRIRRDGARYFGPFMAGVSAKEIVEIINCTFLLRSCNMNISPENKKRECLKYHIKRCMGPCNGFCTESEYNERVNSALDFLAGNDDEAEQILQSKMQFFAENEDFELAILYRDRINSLKKIREKKITSLNRFISCDVIAIVSDNIHSAINVLITRGGRMQGGKYFALDCSPASIEENLESFIMRFYDKNNQVPDEIIVNRELSSAPVIEQFFKDNFGKRTDIIFAKQGVRRQLTEMAELNAADYLEKSIDKIKHKADMTVLACNRLKQVLQLEKYPKRIECYDISDISGVDKVGAMIVFIDGVKAPDLYRRFKIKTVEGADDFACLKEVLTRRIERYKTDSERFEKPDLVIIDGGKGQLSAVEEVFKAQNFDVPLASVAKQHEEIFTQGSNQPILLEKSDYCLRLVQRIRDETHRFAITYHRTTHLKKAFSTELKQIDGLGKKRIEILLNEFKTVGEIAKADVNTLAAVRGIGEKQAQIIFDYFKDKREKINKED